MDIPKCRATNLKSSSGRKIVNQIEIVLPGVGRYFSSYGVNIAFIPEDPGSGPLVFLDPGWTYSTTTGKYRNRFLGVNGREVQRRLDRGEYAVAELN